MGGEDRHLSTPSQNFAAPGSQGFTSSPHEGVSVEERRILEWITQLLSPVTRESALLELSKKREQFPQLALILWHSFGMGIVCLDASKIIEEGSVAILPKDKQIEEETC